MGVAVLAERPDTWRVVVAMAFALFIAFVIGGAAGYGVRALAASGTTAAAPAVVYASAPCASGTHPTVWYTAHTWSCSPDQAQP